MNALIITTSACLLLCNGAAGAATPAAVAVQYEWEHNGDNRLDWEAIPPDSTAWYKPRPDTPAAARHQAEPPARRPGPRAELKKAPLSPVPEPGVASMLLVGLVILMLAGRVPRAEKFSA